MVTGSEIVLAGIAAIAAGFINAIAGGGSLVSFPALVALGIPEVAANITNTVALCPGDFGGAIAQKAELKGQARRLLPLITAGIIGGLFGAFLLLNIGEGIFHVIVPILILLASGLLAIQNRVRTWITNYSEKRKSSSKTRRGIFFPITISAIYGGYFGAGLSVIVLAVLGVFYDDSLTQLNAFKQCISLGINAAAAVVFIFSGMVVWSLVIVMAIGALAGGIIGGNVSERVNPEHLRWLIVLVGFTIGLVLLIRL